MRSKSSINLSNLISHISFKTSKNRTNVTEFHSNSTSNLQFQVVEFTTKFLNRILGNKHSHTSIWQIGKTFVAMKLNFQLRYYPIVWKDCTLKVNPQCFSTANNQESEGSEFLPRNLITKQILFVCPQIKFQATILYIDIC